MPSPGGASDKLGNSYEGLWVFDHLLKIVDHQILSITLEPLDDLESRGIEFRVGTLGDQLEYWSVKRQTAKGQGWSLALLTNPDETGRSILGDLLEHVERRPGNRAALASSLGARDLNELKLYAKDARLFEARLEKSGPLKDEFKRILSLCGGDASRAIVFLNSLSTHAIDEDELRARVDFAARKLLHPAGGGSLDPAVIRGHLAQIALKRIHERIDRATLLRDLNERGVRTSDWSIEPAVTEGLRALQQAFAAPLTEQLLDGKLMSFSGAAPLLDESKKPKAARMLISAEAGAGKSCALLGAMTDLVSAGTPVIPIRFDALPSGILTTRELGQKLGLPESPAVVLAGICAGARTGVLLVDQLDAISQASGRRTELWALFDQLKRELDRYPNLSLMVGCRGFDLEHDQRMRALRAADSQFLQITLRQLTDAEVDALMVSGEVDPSLVPDVTKHLLRLPLHLAIYLTLPIEDRAGIVSREALFDRYWDFKQQKTAIRLERPALFTEVIDQLLDWLSTNQRLSAPEFVLDTNHADSRAMVSEHVLTFADGQFRFFHETFFDYCFARRFAATGRRLRDFLIEHDQHLFRRAQVRQVLSYLRNKDRTTYVKDLRALLLSPKIRAHIKVLALNWLSTLTNPTLEEWAVVCDAYREQPGLERAVQRISAEVAWFDIADARGELDKILSSDAPADRERAIRTLGAPSILKSRSERVAELLERHRRPGAEWENYLYWLFRVTRTTFGPKMTALLLKLIDEDVFGKISLEGPTP